MWDDLWKKVAAYSVAVALIGLTVEVLFYFDTAFDAATGLAALGAAALASAWWMGLGPGLVALVLATGAYYFLYTAWLPTVALAIIGAVAGMLAVARQQEESSLRKAATYWQQYAEKRQALYAQRGKQLAIEQAARQQAEADVRTRDEFLAIASHELKTPLTTILLKLQATLRNILTQSVADFSGEKLVKSLTMAEEQSKRLQKMIKDLFTLSHLSGKKMELEVAITDLTELVRSLVAGFEEQFKRAECTLAFQATGPIVGRVDAVRIEQALSNLLTNALKFGSGKPIEVSVGVEGEAAVITVRDYGIGIEAKDQVVIFERFTRADNRFDGMGVGLFIVQQIAEAHGGSVRVESKPGEGSAFSLMLPLAGIAILAEVSTEPSHAVVAQ